MTQWAVVIPTERYDAERLLHNETVEIDGAAVGGPLHGGPEDGGSGHGGPEEGDEALVVVGGEPPRLVALGRVRAGSSGGVAVAYTRRVFDAPRPATGLVLDAAVTPVEPAVFAELAGRLGPAADLRTWLVSVDLPIEAETPAEAVRQFWSYVQQLGPRELPAFVSPSGDELAMQAYLLGEEANLDPEEGHED